MLSGGNQTLARSVGRHIFGQDAAGYDAVRLGYPAALYEALFERAGPPTRLGIFEVGPGTGLATRVLLASQPARLRVIEPDAILAERLAVTFSGLEIEVGAFEQGRADGGAFDLGVAAACFHWVDPAPGMRQVKRLLRPQGCWAMWWNVYRAAGVGDDFADRIVPVLRDFALPPSETAGGHISLDRDYQEGLLRDAGFRDVGFLLYRRERTLDATAMRALYASYSFVRALDTDRREQLLDMLADIVEREFGGTAPNVVLTPMYMGTAP